MILSNFDKNSSTNFAQSAISKQCQINVSELALRVTAFEMYIINKNAFNFKRQSHYTNAATKHTYTVPIQSSVTEDFDSCYKSFVLILTSNYFFVNCYYFCMLLWIHCIGITCSEGLVVKAITHISFRSSIGWNIVYWILFFSFHWIRHLQQSYLCAYRTMVR